MFYEGILWDSDAVVALDEIDESLVGEIEVKSIGMVEVVLSNIDLSLVHACVSGWLLL